VVLVAVGIDMDGLHELLIAFSQKMQSMDVESWWKMVSSNAGYQNYAEYFIDELAYCAIDFGRGDVLSFLISRGFDVNNIKNQRGLPINLCLYPISRIGKSLISAMLELINGGALVNKVDPVSGLYPLMHAIENDAFVHAVLLLDRGADPFLKSHVSGGNSFEYAEIRKKYAFVACMREFV